MKKNRLLSIIFSVMLLCCLTLAPSVTVHAQGLFSLDFSLSVNGKQVVSAGQNDVITVSFTMTRTDSNENYTTNGFQNKIYYDLEFFEFVEGSIVCYDTGSAIAKKQNNIAHGEIIQCQNFGKTYESSFVFCTFQLKVIASSGSGMVHNSEVYAFEGVYPYPEVTVTTKDLQVNIGDSCDHIYTTKVDAKEPSCEEKGWEEYYVCDDCNVILDKNGYVLPDIPYIDESHNFSTTLSHDENGHWYECVCGEKSNYEEHSGGTATCTQKAVCSACSTEYGEVNANNHLDASLTKVDAQAPSCDTKGWETYYTCNDCNAILDVNKNVIPSIPYVDETHNFSTTLSHDESGHWYECVCGEKSNYEEHSGGTATCTQKAVCSACGAEYGEVNANNHLDASLTKVDAQAPSCDTKGWETYYTCNDCNAILDVNKNVLTDIPYIDETHNFSTTLSHDENGHWYECECGEKSGYEEHTGTATCGKKAVCDVCGVEYGEVNADNHEHTKREGHKYSWFFGKGYSGDLYCTDCGKLIEQGRVTDEFEFDAWAWWGWLLFIIFLPIIVVIRLLMVIFGSV